MTPQPIRRLPLLLAALVPLAACALDDAPDTGSVAAALATAAPGLGVTRVDREQVRGDIYHYTIEVAVGDSAHARLRLHRIVRERAPWQPRPTTDGILLLHGDFATFVANFAPSLISGAADNGGLAVYLAQ